LQAGQSVHIGGLTRLDVLEASVQTIYVTVWASASISLHLGKTETAEELRSKHVGIRLQVTPISDLLNVAPKNKLIRFCLIKGLHKYIFELRLLYETTPRVMY
jgi:hypothetical protein